jgi:hypothetical protein
MRQFPEHYLEVLFEKLANQIPTGLSALVLLDDALVGPNRTQLHDFLQQHYRKEYCMWQSLKQEA